MGWLVLANIFSALMALFSVHKLSEEEKDLEILIPALAVAIELRRYFYPISEVAKAANAVAVAASAEINQGVFRDSGSLVATAKTWGVAQSYVSSNTAGLAQRGLHAFVTDIQVSGGATRCGSARRRIYRSCSLRWCQTWW